MSAESLQAMYAALDRAMPGAGFGPLDADTAARVIAEPPATHEELWGEAQAAIETLRFAVADYRLTLRNLQAAELLDESSLAIITSDRLSLYMLVERDADVLAAGRGQPCQR